MTRRMSLVAVCCSRASLTCACACVSASFFCCNSVNNRTFSIAMTAWLAKVATNSICLSVNGRTSRRWIVMAPTSAFSLSMGTASAVRIPSAS